MERGWFFLANNPGNFEFKGQPLEVKVYDNFERAMKIFKSLVQKERILSLYKEKSRYEKPSDKKRRKRNEMKRKLLELETKIFTPENSSFSDRKNRRENESDSDER